MSELQHDVNHLARIREMHAAFPQLGVCSWIKTVLLAMKVSCSYEHIEGCAL